MPKSYTAKKCPHCDKTFKVLKRHIDSAHYYPEYNKVRDEYCQLRKAYSAIHRKAWEDAVSQVGPEPPTGNDGYNSYIRWWSDIQALTKKHPDLIQFETENAKAITDYLHTINSINAKYGQREITQIGSLC